jgi:hypothetical protein
MAAGLGFKDFTTGEVLTAADVDGYLMQGIWVFADATARDAAVTSPQEGNACYLKDTNEVLTYSGTAWVAVGASPTWTTYTPTNVGITVGNGTQIARFSEIGNIVFVSYKFTLGSTSSVTGSVSVGLPSTNNSVASCSVLISDTGTGRFTCMGRADTSAGNVLIRPVRTDATYGGWSDTLGGMFTWASTDFIEFSITYEKA